MAIAARIVRCLGVACCLFWWLKEVPAAIVASGVPLPGADAPPFMLTEREFFDWRTDSNLSDDRNISRVPLARRFVDIGSHIHPRASLDPNVRVLIAPDGMNNFGNYLMPQPRFNLYTFTHWSLVDILVWFGGSANRPISIPARPWIDAAHRNGVKVLGTVFFAPAPWGGSPATVERFLRRDRKGGFPAADQLVAIARHYGFDGWLMNQETDLRGPGTPAAPKKAAELGRTMVDFMAYLTRTAPEPMEIDWYDSMVPDGSVAWQGALTARNLPFLQDGPRRVSDALFLDYGWTRETLRRGAALAERSGRNRYELFVGADLWPDRNAQPAFRNVRWLDDLRDTTGRALGSIALFAPNFNFNDRRFSRFESDPGDVQRFYAAEVRLFAGESMASGHPNPHGWPGISSLVPARSTITALPFQTHFNTGHGLHDARGGRTIGGPWHDMSRQDILPTWQFAVPRGSGVHVQYDFARPYEGGSSLEVDAAAPKWAEVPLYLTRLPVGAATRLTIVEQTESRGFEIRLTLDDDRKLDLPLRASFNWRHESWCLGRQMQGRLRRISILVRPPSDQRTASLRLGGLSLKNEKTCVQL